MSLGKGMMEQQAHIYMACFLWFLITLSEIRGSAGAAPHIIFDPSPNSEALPPNIEGVARSLHPSPSPTHIPKNHNGPTARPPADVQAPIIPVWPADDMSPSSSISPIAQPSQMPLGNRYGLAPANNAPIAMLLAPVLSSPWGSPIKPPASHTARSRDSQRPAASPTSSLPPDVYEKRYGVPVAAPPEEIPNHLSPAKRMHVIGHSSVLSPIPHEAGRAPKYSPEPSKLHHGHAPPKLVPIPAPAISHHQHEARKNVRSPFSPPNSIPPSYIRGPAISPAPLHHPTVQPNHGGWHHALPPFMWSAGPAAVPVESPSSLTDAKGAAAPSPLSPAPSFPIGWRSHSPTPPPSGSFSRKSRAPVPQPIRAFPPPPPNLDCLSLPCTEPYTNPPPGSPCVCALPMKVKLRLGVALYTFFPLVSELAQEIADGVFVKQSQVRVMGANAASEQPEKTIVLIDLVPLGQKFDNAMALLAYERFWRKKIDIRTPYFGDYDVLYVLYPGLPPSPPLPSSDVNTDGPFGVDNNSRTIHPLGVDVRKKRKEKNSATIVAVVVVSSAMAFVLCAGAAWFLLLKLKHGGHTHCSMPAPQVLMPPYVKASAIGTGPTLSGSGPGSTSGSLSSSIATFTGTTKTFSVGEMERATNKFDDSSIIGEGGFGRVYKGSLEDGTRVAVKVLKRDDQQGSREFLAEIEMLSRLHHRNLVKLIGICTEEYLRCLVYELIPNGSVESHLHGVDKETTPLDWGARMKIALGSARALAYLHEDSSPRVIHRDFKSSNILLEYDFTPKVSDFGLARTALDEGNGHISTRVMGTFGYVAPEYALTGHLLVKSDVYSYGVVLLELLTGRKPVDMSQPPGQENLVAWAHPLLTSKEDLESIIDPALSSNFPFDSVAKVAAIASMCVQPEVSHRPFMGEVVQALKLVCNESDELCGAGSFSLEDLPPSDMETKLHRGVGFESDRALSSSEISPSARCTREASGSFRRHSSSGPLKTNESGQFWQRVRGLSGGSMSEDGLALRFNSNVEGSEGSSGWS
uniref:Receptor-like serine/threonine-protein kinase ALE2 n=1 Tax=Anthurium amnicola TaxID=1678845 RepID=A0A1D1YGG7_9ARAE